jgi:hypothetical protein
MQDPKISSISLSEEETRKMLKKENWDVNVIPTVSIILIIGCSQEQKYLEKDDEGNRSKRREM